MTYSRDKRGQTYHLSSCRYSKGPEWTYAHGLNPQELWKRLMAVGAIDRNWNKPCYYCLGIWYFEHRRTFQ